MLKKLLACALATVLLAAALPLAAQDQPVVYAVMFYSPSCPHCHKVIDDDLPGIMAEFGDRLQLLLVDVTTPSGRTLALSAYEHYRIDSQHRVVPMLIVNDQVLIGSLEIPQRLPEIARAGLAAGGIAMPAFPGMREVFESVLARQAETSAAVDEAAETPPAPAAGAPARAEQSLPDRLAADPVANLLAIAVLGGLVVSLGAVIVAGLGSLSSG
ncbi:MAG: hypothetical protein ACUVSX_11520, partial [Aggregatilineales bacterium]